MHKIIILFIHLWIIIQIPIFAWSFTLKYLQKVGETRLVVQWLEYDKQGVRVCV